MTIGFLIWFSLLGGISSRAANMVLILYALELGAKPLTVGLLAATYAAVPLIFAVPTGKLADRFGSRWLLIITTVGGALGMCLPYATPNFVTIFIAAGLIGLSWGTNMVLIQNLVGLVSSAETRAKSYSSYSLTGSLSAFAGPLTGGLLFDHVGHGTTCGLIALLSLVPVALLMVRRDDMRAPAHEHETHKGGSTLAMLAEPGVRRVLLVSSLQNAGKDLYLTYMPVYAHAIGLTASTIGIVLAIHAAAMFVVRAFLPRLTARYTEEQVLMGAFYLAALALMLIPFFEDPYILAVISFVLGLGIGCSGPIVMMMMFTGSAQGRSGEAMGLRMAVNHFTRLVGPIFFGSIASAAGMSPIFWLNAALLFSGGVMSRSPVATVRERVPL